MRTAMALASSGVTLPEVTTMNSSPPRRAMVSTSRSSSCRRRATACSSRSPVWWPWVSFIFLKWSRSMNSTAAAPPLRRVCQQQVEAQVQRQAVVQAGQRVVVGQLVDVLLGALLLGQVVQDGDEQVLRSEE